VKVGFNILFNTLCIISETIFPANHLTGAKTQSSLPITWSVLETRPDRSQVTTQKHKQQLQMTTNICKQN